MADLAKIVDDLSKLTVLEAAELSKLLEENVRAFADAVSKAKPAGAKGNYIKKVSVTSTMGPGLKLDIASLTAAS